jgi:hypothetical protein
MKRTSTALLVLVLLLLVSLAAAQAASPGLQTLPTSAAEPSSRPGRPAMQAGNYCIGCHTPGDPRLETVTHWFGGIDRSAYSSCPAALRIQEELYYTERLLLAAGTLQGRLPSGPSLDRAAARLEASEQAYSRLLDTPVSSLDAFVLEAQMLRYQLGKTYAHLSQMEESLKARNVMIGAILITLIVLFSLGWGMWNAQKALRIPQSIPAQPVAASAGLGSLRVALLLVVLVLFALPTLRTPAVEEAIVSESEQARQETLDTSSRSATAADRALARSWSLAAVAAAWEPFDSEQAATDLSVALASARESRYDSAALWGGAQAVYEVSAGSTINQEKAGLVAAQLDANRSRAWGLRMIANEWSTAAPHMAQAILDEALLVARGATGIYKDLDYRTLAVAWAEFDLARSLQVANLISDPAVESWALREIAGLAPQGEQSAEIYAKAAQAARAVSSPLQRSCILAEIAKVAGKNTLFSEARQALLGVDGQTLAYALSELAAISGEQSFAEQIDPAYPVARTSAFYRVGEYEQAWNESARIEDPFERGRSQEAIAAAWQNAGAANRIELELLRNRALAGVAVSTGDKTLVENISSAYYRVQALTGLGETARAWEATPVLQDHYPLLGLGKALAGSQPAQVLEIVELLDREADKSALLNALVAHNGDPELFERAMGMAMAARVRGDALAPVNAALDLAYSATPFDRVLARQALLQAKQAAERISIK